MFWTHLNPLEPPKPPKKSKKVIVRDIKIGAGVLKAIWATPRPLLIGLHAKTRRGGHNVPPPLVIGLISTHQSASKCPPERSWGLAPAISPSAAYPHPAVCTNIVPCSAPRGPGWLDWPSRVLWDVVTMGTTKCFLIYFRRTTLFSILFIYDEKRRPKSC